MASVIKFSRNSFTCLTRAIQSHRSSDSIRNVSSVVSRKSNVNWRFTSAQNQTLRHASGGGSMAYVSAAQAMIGVLSRQHPLPIAAKSGEAWHAPDQLVQEGEVLGRGLKTKLESMLDISVAGLAAQQLMSVEMVPSTVGRASADAARVVTKLMTVFEMDEQTMGLAFPRSVNVQPANPLLKNADPFVQHTLNQSFNRVSGHILRNKEKLDSMVALLQEKGELSADEVKQIVDG